MKLRLACMIGFMILFLCIPLYAYAECEHNYVFDRYEKSASDSSVYHNAVAVCKECGDEYYVKEPHGRDDFQTIYKPCDVVNHYKITKCKDCHESTEVIKEPHDYYHNDFIPVDCDDTYHYYGSVCFDCSEIRIEDKQKHNMGLYDAISDATLTKKGVAVWTCDVCDKEELRSFSWKRNGDYCKDYYIYRSTVYKNSTSINIKIKSPVKGSVLKVKIEGKTYTKKLGATTKKVTFKIKKPRKYGIKVSAKIYYKGKLISIDDSASGDWVYYAKKIKKGMTPKQVTCTKGWECPDKKRNISKGTFLWFYDDKDAVVGFKKGKVKFWSYY